MKKGNFLRIISLSLGAFLLNCIALHAAPQQQPDNTSANKQESAQGAVTADQQKETATDRELAKRIRQSILDDKTLSTYAHNVKVIARNGEVTLKGPVKSEDEKSAIEAKATAVAGVGKVQNELTVKM